MGGRGHFTRTREEEFLLRAVRNFPPKFWSTAAPRRNRPIPRDMLSSLALGFSPTTPACRPVPSQQMAANARAGELGMNFGRRAFLGGAAASALLTATPALAKIDSINPANNYYFPMARYACQTPWLAPSGPCSVFLCWCGALVAVWPHSDLAPDRADRPSIDICRASSVRGSPSTSWLLR